MNPLQSKVGRLFHRHPGQRHVTLRYGHYSAEDLTLAPVETSAPEPILEPAPVETPEPEAVLTPDAVESPAPEPVAIEAAYDPVAALRLGYRLFLGRDVEEEYVDELARIYPTARDLRHYFLHLSEFRCQVAPKRTPPLTGLEPPMQVEVDLGEEELQTLFAHVQATWQRFGETEPHWSVSTSQKFLQENLAESREEFYTCGKWDADRLFASLARNGIDASAFRSCLELGCGVGRVSLWLAKRFEQVIGYDISEAHLRAAAAEFETRGVEGVTFRHLARPGDLHDLPKVDAAFTVVVLQHNPPPIIKIMIEGLIRALNPGGVAFFQVPTYYVGYRFCLADYLANDASTHETMEMHVLSQDVVFEIVRREGARVVEVIEDPYTLCREGEVSSTFLVRKD